MYESDPREPQSHEEKKDFVLSGTPYSPDDPGQTPPQSPKYTLNQKKKSTHSPAVRVACLALCCALAGGAAGAGTVLAMNRSNTVRVMTSGERDNTTVQQLTVNPGETMTYRQIYNAYSPSVVSVTVETATGTGAGTGFLISEDGYLLTCYHVVEGATAMSVTFNDDGESCAATYVGGDSDLDVAVLKIEGVEHTLTPVVLGNSGELAIGDTVTSIGNALGTLSNTATAGIVSATNRAITMSDGTVRNLLQTDCAINSGNSGGPLFNAFGEVVGIVSAKYSGTSNGTSTGASIEGIGFAIPIDNVKAVLNDLIEHGYITGKPSLGITVSTVTPLTAQRYQGYVVGAYVNDVTAGSCAEAAGLQKGDIITAVDGTTITTSAELIDAKNTHRAGDEMQLTVYRGGESLLIVVTLDEQQPDTSSIPGETTEESQQQEQNDSSSSGGQQGGFGSGFGSFFDWPFGFGRW